MIHSWFKNFSWVFLFSLLSDATMGKNDIKPSDKKDIDSKEVVTEKSQKSTAVHSLEDALHMAYRYNVEIQSAFNQVKIAQENCFKARAEWTPNIDFSLATSFTPSRGSGVENIGTIQYPDEVFSLTSGKNRYVAANFTIGQNIYNGGATKANNELALESYKETWCDFKTQMQDVFLGTLNAFIDVTTAREYYLIAKMREKSLSVLREIARKRALAGEQRMGDVSLANAQCISKSMEVNSSKKEYFERKNILGSYIGVPIGEELDFPAPIDVPVYAIHDFITLCLKSNPASQKNRHAERKMRCRVRAQGATFLPKMDLTITPSLEDQYTLQKVGIKNNFNTPSTASLAVTINVKMPIYDGGIRQADYRTTELDYKRTRLETEKQNRELVLKCKNADFAYQIALQNVVSAREGLKEQGAVFASAREEYALGATTMVDLLGLEEQYAMAIRKLIEALGDVVKATYQFKYLSGQLTPDKISTQSKNYDIAAYRKKIQATLFTFGENQAKASLYDQPSVDPTQVFGCDLLKKQSNSFDLKDLKSALKEGIDWYPAEGIALQDQTSSTGDSDLYGSGMVDQLLQKSDRSVDAQNLDIEQLMSDALKESASYLETGDDGVKSIEKSEASGSSKVLDSTSDSVAKENSSNNENNPKNTDKK